MTKKEIKATAKKWEVLRAQKATAAAAERKMPAEWILDQIYRAVRDGERAAEANRPSAMDAAAECLRHYVTLIPDCLDMPLSERF